MQEQMENDESLRQSETQILLAVVEEELMLLQQGIAFETAAKRAELECVFGVLLDEYLGETGDCVKFACCSKAVPIIKLPMSTRAQSSWPETKLTVGDSCSKCTIHWTATNRDSDCSTNSD